MTRSWSDFMHVESVKRPRCTAMFFYVLNESCQVTFYSSLISESSLFRKETQRCIPADVCFLLISMDKPMQVLAQLIWGLTFGVFFYKCVSKFMNANIFCPKRDTAVKKTRYIFLR